MTQATAGRPLTALGELRAFLRRASMPDHDAALEAIERRIVDPATRREGLRELEQGFAGMGSLNDVSERDASVAASGRWEARDNMSLRGDHRREESRCGT